MSRPQNKEKMCFAVERFKVDIQQAIHEAMQDEKVHTSGLAKRLNISEIRTNRFFDPACNINVSMLVKIFHVLGKKISLKIEDI